MMPSSTKPVIVLDAGNVLVEFDQAILLHAVSQLCGRTVGYPLPETVQTLCVRQEVGDCSLEMLADGLNEFLGLSLSTERWRALWCSIFVGEVPGMRAALQALKKEFTLVAMSNTCDVHWDFVLDRYPIFGLLDGWVVSYAEGLAKPDPGLYRIVMDRYCGGQSPFFYTDDVATYVDAASALTWPASVFRDAQQFRRDVAGFMESLS